MGKRDGLIWDRGKLDVVGGWMWFVWMRSRDRVRGDGLLLRYGWRDVVIRIQVRDVDNVQRGNWVGTCCFDWNWGW